MLRGSKELRQGLRYLRAELLTMVTIVSQELHMADKVGVQTIVFLIWNSNVSIIKLLFIRMLMHSQLTDISFLRWEWRHAALLAWV